MQLYEATLPMYKGTLKITGTSQCVTSIEYVDAYLQEQDGFKEVYKAKQQLYQYINKTRTTFDVCLDYKRTPFINAVYEALMKVQAKEVISYKQLAINAGYPKAARAVGMAMATNKHLIMIPCHRVIASDHSLGGFTGGLELKQFLLNHEQN